MTTSETDTGGGGLADRLREARAERERVETDIAEAGEESVVAAADAYRTSTDLLDRYVDSATGTGDFESYVTFQEKFLGLVESLDDDVPARDAFEDAADLLDKRRLSESDFERARELLEPAREYVDLLERRQETRERVREIERDVNRRYDEVTTAIAEHERLQRLGDADLDAPTERLREPIAAYNESVREDFRTFKHDASARDVLEFVATTESYPLVDYRQPPPELVEYVESNPAGEEPIPTLLEYADYSPSKLDHYVEDAGALRTRVAVHQTYLERLGADPLTVAWPPASGPRLRHRASELVSVVGRFAGEETVARLREIRDLPRTTDYDRLRDAAEAEAELTDGERERLRSGDVADELERLRAERDRLDGVR